MSTGSRSTRQANLLQKRIGANLQAIREAAGLSQRGLADAASGPLKPVSQAEIQRLEAGTAIITVVQLIVLSRALGVHPYEIADIDELKPHQQISGLERAILTCLRAGDHGGLMLALHSHFALAASSTGE